MDLWFPEDVRKCIVTYRRKATGQPVTCWFLFTVAVLKQCCYRTAKLYLPAVELDYKLMKVNVVLFKLSVVPVAEYNITVNSEILNDTTEHLKLQAKWFRDKHEPWSIQIIGMEKNALKTTNSYHTCVLVICIRTYIYRKLIALPMGNCGIQPLLLALWTKCQIFTYNEIATISTKSSANL